MQTSSPPSACLQFPEISINSSGDILDCVDLISILCLPTELHYALTLHTKANILDSLSVAPTSTFTEGISRGNGYLVAVIGGAAGVKAGQKALGLLLDTGRCWQGQQQRGQLLSCIFVSLLMRKTGGLPLSQPHPCGMHCLHPALFPPF